MLLGYLFAAIVGGALLGGSVFVGDHHGGGGDAGSDSGGASDAGDGSHGADHDLNPGLHAGLSPAAVLFSVRTWTYFLAFGGATGLLLRLVAHAGEPLTSLVAVSVGAVTGVGARIAFRRALSAGSGGTVRSHDLVGRSGQLLLPCGNGQIGQVRLTVKGSTVDLLARSDEPGVLEAREEVMIVEVKEGEALVVRART